MSERPKVGLASNPGNVPFRCDHCTFYKKGTCHNDDPELFGRSVEEDWCCDFYRHPGMRVIVK